MKKKIKYEEVIMSIYPSIDTLIEQVSKKIVRKAYASFLDNKDVASQAVSILTSIENRDKLYKLKKIVSKVLTRISEEEKTLFNYKYFNNRVIEGFDCSSRNYFRKQNRAIKHLGELLSYIGLSEEVFYSEYGELACVRAELNKDKKYDIALEVECAREMFG